MFSEGGGFAGFLSKEIGTVEQQGDMPEVKNADIDTPKEAEFAVFRLFCSFVFGRIRKGESA